MAYSDGYAWNGTPLPMPTGIKIIPHDISSDASGRSLSALMNKDLIAVKHDVELTWNALTTVISAILHTLLKGNIYGTLTYPSAESEIALTGTFYTGDPTEEYVSFIDGSYYWAYTITFIER